MSKIIEFSSRGREDKKNSNSTTSKEQKNLFQCEIPDLGSMYDESAIRMADSGISVEEFRVKALASVSEGTQRKAEALLEVALASARAEMIAKNLKSKEKRKAALSELGRVTYASGMRLDEDRIMDMGRAALTAGVGQRRALVIIENMRIASQAIQPAKPPEQVPQQPPLKRPQLRLV